MISSSMPRGCRGRHYLGEFGRLELTISSINAGRPELAILPIVAGHLELAVSFIIVGLLELTISSIRSFGYRVSGLCLYFF